MKQTKVGGAFEIKHDTFSLKDVQKSIPLTKLYQIQVLCTYST